MEWIKQNWTAVAILLLLAGVALSLWKNHNLTEVISINEEAYKKEISVLKDFHAKELQDRAKLIEEHKVLIEKLQKDYERSRQLLSIEKKKKVKIIIKEQQETPELLAKRIKRLYGLDEYVE